VALTQAATTGALGLVELDANPVSGSPIALTRAGLALAGNAAAAMPVTNLAAAATSPAGSALVVCNSTTAAFTGTLPTLASTATAEQVWTLAAGSNVVTIAGSINGSTTANGILTSVGDTYRFLWDGTALTWRVGMSPLDQQQVPLANGTTPLLPAIQWGNLGTIYGQIRADSQSNLGVGVKALQSNTTGYYNTAAGVSALQSNTTGTYNTAAGAGALLSNTTGNNNTAAGVYALLYNTTGTYNTAVGVKALQSNTTGGSNTAAGVNALLSNTTGYNNAAAGVNALLSNTTGNNNTAAGGNALLYNTTGNYNTAVGFGSGYPATTANATTTALGQTLIGYQTGQSVAAQVNYVTALGYQALVGAPGAMALGVDSTGTGAVSNVQDTCVIGTALTTLQISHLAIATQSPLVAGDKYLVISSTGAVHVSALGPAS
jgi:hypothetical protein